MNHDTNLRGRFTPQPPGGNLETSAATSALVARWRGDYTLQVSHRNGEMVSTVRRDEGCPARHAASSYGTIGFWNHHQYREKD